MYGTTVTISLLWIWTAMMTPGLSLFFDPQYRDRIEPLKKGDSFCAKGQIYGVSEVIVSLRNCVLEDPPVNTQGHETL